MGVLFDSDLPCNQLRGLENFTCPYTLYLLVLTAIRVANVTWGDRLLSSKYVDH